MKIGLLSKDMSFAEAAFNAPPVGRPFDFSKAMSDARRVLVKRVLPNLRGATKFTYRKTAAAGAVLAWPLFKLEEISTFNDAHFPAPDMSAEYRELRRLLLKFLSRSTIAAATFTAALLAPTNFSTRSHIQGYEPDFTIVSQSQATVMPVVEALPLCPIEGITTREACGAEINRRYHARRARLQPEIEVAPVHVRERAVQTMGGMEVTSIDGGDEYRGF
jgi:hypothetical protein